MQPRQRLGDCSRFQDIFLRLGLPPSNEEEMVELEAFLHESAGLLSRLNSELNEQRKALRFLTEQSYAFSEEELRLIGERRRRGRVLTRRLVGPDVRRVARGSLTRAVVTSWPTTRGLWPQARRGRGRTR